MELKKDELGKDFLETAKSDLESAMFLYEKKKYNNSIFLLQQSVEKCVKSLGLNLRLVDENQLKKKINHSPHKVFTRLLLQKIEKEEKKDSIPILVPEAVPKHWNIKSSPHLPKMKSLYQRINHLKIDEMEKVDYCCIDNFLERAIILSKKEVNKDEAKEIIKEDWIKTNTHFRDLWLRMKDEDEIDNGIDYNDMIKNPEKFIGPRVSRFIDSLEVDLILDFITFVWLNLSIITTPHEQKSRYPANKNNGNPIDWYDEEHPVVKLFPRIVEVMNLGIDQYEKLKFKFN